jgi:ATP-binding cassette subfamily B protein/subfamily B ATP-binding cassette protein MsbA
VTADSSCLSVIVKDALFPVLSSVISLIVMFLILWRIDAVLASLALAIVPFMALAFRMYARPMMDLSYEQQETEGRIYTLVEQVFSAIPVIQAYTAEGVNENRLREAARQTIAATLRLTTVQLKFKVLIGLATAVGTAGILWVGTQHAMSGELTVGAIILFLSYLGSLYAPLETLMYSTSTIQGAAGSARRVWEVLQAEPDLKDSPAARPIVTVKGLVQFEGVTFGYTPGTPVLRDITLTVKPGERVALVGPTGSGKSTLVSMIPRFLDPWSGRVCLDGTDIRELQIRSLRRHISIVLQESFLFPITIAENIAYGRPGATMHDIEQAARAANADAFIQRLPRGYQTVVGERGATLSGGERQRISIARALLKDAPILILDEPTSALDTRTEHQILEAWDRLSARRTTFIIAHRLSTICHADRVLVIEQGKIVESGTHQELLARGQTYARYHAIQFGTRSSSERAEPP